MEAGGAIHFHKIARPKVLDPEIGGNSGNIDAGRIASPYITVEDYSTRPNEEVTE